MLPTVADQMKHLAIVRSLVTNEGSHERGTTLMNTGRAPSPITQFPALGAVCASELASKDLPLPGFIGIGPYAEAPAETLQAYRSAVRDLASCPNVVVKLGGQAMTIRGFNWHEAPLPPSSGELAAAWKPIMETCIEAFGADRCMFESNFPVDKGMCSYPVIWNAFKRLAGGCSTGEKAALFHDTAARFYRLG